MEPAATVLRNAKELVLKHKEYPAEFELIKTIVMKHILRINIPICPGSIMHFVAPVT